MPEIKERLIRILRRRPEIRLAILFGSRATGGARPESDIDLALLGHEPLSKTTIVELIEAISGEFGCPVDIVDLYDVPQPITGEAFKGVRLLGDNRTYAELLTRHHIESADFLPLRQRTLRERLAAWTR